MPAVAASAAVPASKYKNAARKCGVFVCRPGGLSCADKKAQHLASCKKKQDRLSRQYPKKPQKSRSYTEEAHSMPSRSKPPRKRGMGHTSSVFFYFNSKRLIEASHIYAGGRRDLHCVEVQGHDRIGGIAEEDEDADHDAGEPGDQDPLPVRGVLWRIPL